MASMNVYRKAKRTHEPQQEGCNSNKETYVTVAQNNEDKITIELVMHWMNRIGCAFRHGNAQTDWTVEYWILDTRNWIGFRAHLDILPRWIHLPTPARHNHYILLMERLLCHRRIFTTLSNGDAEWCDSIGSESTNKNQTKKESSVGKMKRLNGDGSKISALSLLLTHFDYNLLVWPPNILATAMAIQCAAEVCTCMLKSKLHYWWRKTKQNDSQARQNNSECKLHSK